MYRQKRYAVALLVGALLLSQAACGPNKLREARKAAHRIQVVTDAAVDTLYVLHRDKVLTPEKTNQIAKVLLRINAGNRTLINRVEALQADTPETRASLIADVRVVAEAVRELKSAGVLGIRSQNGTLAFEATLNALDSALAIIEATLAGK